MKQRTSEFGRAVWAMVMLGFAFWRRQFMRVITLGGDDGGEARFLANYAHEGMSPMVAADEQLIEGLGACIYCGLCAAVCPQPVDRWLAYSRATDMAEYAVTDLAAEMGCGDCTECAAICPAGVPLEGVMAFIRGRAAKR
jgi:ferredoxin